MVNHKEQKTAMIIIVLLFVILFPIGALSVFSKATTVKENEQNKNPNHEFHYDGKLWFYTKDVLLGTYTCETPNCNYAIGSYDDSKYHIESYEPEDNELTLPLQSMVFLTDNNLGEKQSIFLYDIASSKANKTITFHSVKNYGKGIADYLYIVENDNQKFGVIQVNGQMNPIIPFQYDFIGLTSNINEDGKIDSDIFVVRQGNSWNLINRENAVLTSGITGEIVNYSEKNIIVVNDGSYSLVDYQNNALIDELFKKLSYTGKYLNCYDEEGDFYIMDLDKNLVLGNKISVKDSDKVSTILNDNKIEVYVNSKLKNTIMLS